MISLTLKDNLNRSTVIVSSTEPLRDIMEANGFDPGTRSIALNGETLTAEDLNMSLSQLGIEGDTATLSAIARKDNA